jgi:hypothetical protein
MLTDLARSTPMPGGPSTGATVAIFALIGPLIGSASMIVFWVASTGGRGAFDLGLLVMVVGAGYIFGSVPAILTGVAVALSWRKDRPPALLGLLYGGLFALLFAVGFLKVPRGDIGGLGSAFVGMGAVAGLVCGMISDWWRD